jgi:ketosteroid isomerase-like protein
MMQSSSAVADATRQSLAAFQNNDADGIRAAFAESDALVVIGTDPAEYFRDHGRMATVFVEQAEALAGMTIEPGAIAAYEQGGVGWSASQPTFRFADGTELPVRLTTVFTREGADWRIVQWHASVGVGNEETTGFEDLPTE